MSNSGSMPVRVNRDLLEYHKTVLCRNRRLVTEFSKMDGYSLLLAGNKMHKTEVLGSTWSSPHSWRNFVRERKKLSAGNPSARQGVHVETHFSFLVSLAILRCCKLTLTCIFVVAFFRTLYVPGAWRPGLGLQNHFFFHWTEIVKKPRIYKHTK